MGIGVSTVLLAVGAILTFAIEVDSAEGFNINTVGIILMIVGAIGLIMTLAIWGPRRRAAGDSVVETRREVY
jgi:hypothetical protein